jgi:hypothetical protein
MVHYSSMLKLLVIGEQLVKSSGSDSLNTIYRTSASELPISKLSSKEHRRPSPLWKDSWSWPTSTSTHPISMSLPSPSPEEGEIIDSITTPNSGEA